MSTKTTRTAPGQYQHGDWKITSRKDVDKSITWRAEKPDGTKIYGPTLSKVRERLPKTSLANQDQWETKVPVEEGLSQEETERLCEEFLEDLLTGGVTLTSEEGKTVTITPPSPPTKH